MFQPNITQKAKDLLAQAEARLFERNKKEIVDAIKGIIIKAPDVYFTPQAIPEIKVPEIKVPEIKIPDFPKQEIVVRQEPIPPIDISEIVKAIKEAKPPIVEYTPPDIKLPDLVWPKDSMPITGGVRLLDIDLTHPLPVQLRDAKGNPVNLGIGGTIMGGGGGGFQNVSISGITSSLAVSIIDSSGVQFDGSNPLPITASSHLDVQQLSGSVNSVNIVNTNTLDVQIVSGAVVSVNIVGENQTLEVLQVSGSTASVNLTQLGGTAIDTNAGDNGAGTMRIISAKSANATTTAVSVGADASTNIALTNLNRKSLAITHNAAFNLYVSTGTAASSTGVPIVTNQVIVFDDYLGPVNAIAQEASGTISVRYIEID